MKKTTFLIATLLCSVAANAAVITVNRADDLVTGGDGGCDLREAVNSANLNFALEDCAAGDDDTLDIILIDVDAAIQLQSEIDVIGSVLIGRFGAGPNIEILAAPGSRHFHVNLTDPGDRQFALVSMHLKNGQVAGDGGSVWIESAEQVEIADNVFENNQAEDGAAIYAEGSVVNDLKIMRNQFISNHAIETSANSAGGALFGHNITNGDLLIQQNLFLNNSADLGGAVYLSEGGDTITISQNRFYNNQAASSGGAMYLTELATGQTYDVTRNVFMHNASAQYGGALYGRGGGQLIINVTNSTLAFNTADQGGAITSNGGNIQVYSTTLAHNGALTAGAQAHQFNGGGISFNKSILAYASHQSNCSGHIGAHTDNIDDDGSCGFAAQDGNLVTDPKLSGLIEFENINPDLPQVLPGFLLTADSAGLDFEDDAICWTPPGIDLDEDQQGASRDVDGDGDGQASCDLGAIESATDHDLIHADSFGI